ncbi:hypothetical protein ZIOFF_055708 [Zingiber officinale]|uniref:NAC domain-containing protein n=1 Tax=Zingiber officinale TaxID=94328 RepID=A0A8J5FGX9_ZINOF|nr:hypothetical protein ZIOFF_055708 [Zingiber officinale]
MNLPPGFRFHPTDEELITHYLAPKLSDSNFSETTVITELDMNKIEPWNLPCKFSLSSTILLHFKILLLMIYFDPAAITKLGEEWYFFCMKNRKNPTGLRTNRATDSGYWKASGKNKEIHGRRRDLIGSKKTLVFYRGRAPKGEKTNWIMHEVFSKNSGCGSHGSTCFSSSHGAENSLEGEFFRDLLADEVTQLDEGWMTALPAKMVMLDMIELLGARAD